MIQNLRIGLKMREWQEQGAREAAWKLAKSVLKFIGARKSNILLTFGKKCLLASNQKPEEREFVVDSIASMYMINKKYSAEMETLTTSKSPTTVITASGEKQTHEEATMYVKELGIFLTLKVLENTPTVLALGKLFDEKRIFL